MIRTMTLAVGLAVSAGAASAALIGGTFYTNEDWNAAATSTLGQQATVFRMYAVFDEPVDRIANVFDANFSAGEGTLFHAEFGGDHAGQINAGLFAPFPATRWDSYVSIGNLHQNSTTGLDPNFEWSSSGVTNNSGWFTQNAMANESIARLPGAGDNNGTLVIPSHFDDSYYYAFLGQFTLLGEGVARGIAPEGPIIGEGFFFSDVFQGEVSFIWNQGDGIAREDTFLIIPTPGAAALFAFAGLAGLRRRR